MMNLNKLPSAPWFVNYSETTDDCGRGPAGIMIGPYEDDVADSFMFSQTFDASGSIPDELDAAFEFAALARNAWEVMKVYGWHAQRNKDTGKWYVDLWYFCGLLDVYGEDCLAKVIEADDPFTALVKARQWYEESCKNKTQPS